MSSQRRPGLILKICVFATGCAGIVAEYVLSTLATYLGGNAVFQWTMVMSLMLFAMGLGSRLSKNLTARLLDSFILVEFSLSLLCASAAVLSYGLAAYTSQISLIIYTLSLIIGGLIGFEIPLVMRLNDAYEDLRTNIAGVMEKDYYGALLGGLFFAFVALPYLGLTYTPVVLGAINFLVASLLLWSFFNLVAWKKMVAGAFAVSTGLLVGLAVLSEPIILFGEQSQFKDKVVYTRQTPYQKIVITQWKKDYWLFLNSQLQFSTFDEERYHEPLVHPAMNLTADRSRVLILGGGDGLALREVFKYPEVRAVTLVDIDKAMTDLASHYPILVTINQGSMRDQRLKIVNRDAGVFIKEDNGYYGVIIVDLPDPDTVDLLHLYSESFYRLAQKHLAPGGVMVTQATSPYFARSAFLCIVKTIRAAGFSVLPYHNQIPTMGEWGWVLGVRAGEVDEARLRQRALALDYSQAPTRFFNREAMISMVHFGKGVFDPDLEAEIEVNTQANPVLNTYYRAGAWAVY
ncbi:MAG: polyamine aminopropyltransferase [Thermodesulfobacteriota bacterium]